MILLGAQISCAQNGNRSQHETQTDMNHLKLESSPYLLQHADNPVNWYPWGEEALEKAEKEDKPILVSIGYAACHWCHVMEHECFENKQLAGIMNEHYVCIKVDREERPDIDDIYMNALHLMGQQGGWPLNVFLTPDQKPFYGGTYFPPQQWEQVLLQVHKAFTEKREKIEATAEQLETRFPNLESVTTRRLSRLTDDLLEASTVQAKGLPIRFQPCSSAAAPALV